jgi:type I restriction enzyme M protein
LSPSRYVRAETADDDDETFNEKMDRLTTQLAEQMAKGVQLDSVIRHKLEALGYAV